MISSRFLDHLSNLALELLVIPEPIFCPNDLVFGEDAALFLVSRSCCVATRVADC